MKSGAESGASSSAGFVDMANKFSAGCASELADMGRSVLRPYMNVLGLDKLDLCSS